MDEFYTSASGDASPRRPEGSKRRSVGAATVRERPAAHLRLNFLSFKHTHDITLLGDDVLGGAAGRSLTVAALITSPTGDNGSELMPTTAQVEVK
jgi:hypothetical protein